MSNAIDHLKLSRYILWVKPFDESGNEVLLFSTRTSAIIETTDYVLDLLLRECFEKIEEETLSLLVKKEFIVDKNEDEFENIISDNQSKIQKNSTLSLTIQPTANCQLGCHYCGQTHSKDYMQEDVYEKMYDRITFLLQTSSCKKLNVCWYGGEPLTRIKTIHTLSDKLLHISFDKGIDYSASMVTNGLALKKAIFEELVEKHKVQSFQITIDGTASYHDTRRITKQGKHTYDTILNNIKEIIQSPFYTKDMIVIRCNVDRTNSNGVSDLIDELANANLKDKIRFYVAPITDWGNNNATENVGIDKKSLASMEIDWLIKSMRNGFASQKNIIPQRQYEVCMVVNDKSEVYDAFGNVYPCWEFPYTEPYLGAEYKIGNLKDDYDTFNTNAITRNWNTYIKEGKTWCKECKFLPVCGGGCPKMWYENQPPCPTFKFNMEERLKLYYCLKKGISL